MSKMTDKEFMNFSESLDWVQELIELKKFKNLQEALDEIESELKSRGCK